MQSPKLLWLKRHAPETFARAGHFLDLTDFLTYRATGALARAPVQPDGVADGIGPGAQLPVLPTSNAAPPSPEVSAAGADAAQASGDVHAQGDTNQIVDPKCVANAAVAALQAGTPAPGPSCGPMQQPEALKAAEKQLSR